MLGESRNPLDRFKRIGKKDTAIKIFSMAKPPIVPTVVPKEGFNLVEKETFEHIPIVGILETAAAEAKTLPALKIRIGPFADDFREILDQTAKNLKKIKHSLPAESLHPPTYQSREVDTRVKGLSGKKQSDLISIKTTKFNALKSMANEKIVPALRGQTIPDDILETPAYQTMEGPAADTQSCFNACFRMVYGDITKKPISEASVAGVMKKVHGQSLVDDEDYLKIFQTRAFQEETEKRVQVASYMGADINTIADRASLIKKRLPQAKVYCIVSLGTESSLNRHIWHTNVLLGADEETVQVHDPSLERGAPNRVLTKERFAQRWATTYNRAHLIIVT